MKYRLEILRKSFVVFPTKISSDNLLTKLDFEKIFLNLEFDMSLFHLVRRVNQAETKIRFQVLFCLGFHGS